MTSADNASRSLAGLVLAGGKSSRMNGREKAALVFDGKTLAERAVEVLKALPCDPIFVSGRRQADILFLQDHTQGLGAIGGLEAAYRNPQLRDRPLLVLPVDMPLLKPADVQPLIDHFEATGNGCRYKGEALPCIVPAGRSRETALRDILLANPESSQSRIRHYLAALDVDVIEAPEGVTLDSVKTPEDWEALVERVSG
jgi:molybdopterin-guanine dinucleotide biosynthesis protein A